MAPVTDTRHLRLLAALDETGSLNAAARQLHLTASALSLQLRELEERLGGPLFRRQWRRLVVTAAGRRLTEAARVMLAELARAEAETRRLLSGASGAIRVATACQQSYRWLPALLKSFAAAWPDIEVTVVTEAAQDPFDWIARRKLDVALVSCVRPDDARVSLQPLFRDELVAVVGRGHPWFGRRQIDPRAFADQHVWLDEGAVLPESPLGRALAEAGDVRPRKLTRVPMTGGVPLEMARANLGLTVLPRWTVEPALAAGDLRAVRIGAGLWLEWSVATRAETPEPPLAAVLDALRVHHPRARARSDARPRPAARVLARPAPAPRARRSGPR